MLHILRERERERIEVFSFGDIDRDVKEGLAMLVIGKRLMFRGSVSSVIKRNEEAVLEMNKTELARGREQGLKREGGGERERERIK